MRLTYQQRMFSTFLLLFVLFAIIVVSIERQQEKAYRTQTLVEQLDLYAKLLHQSAERDTSSLRWQNATRLLVDSIRLTVISRSGDIVFDNNIENVHQMDNHTLRPEIREAGYKGFGRDIRLSSSTNKEYLYYARAYPDYFIRVALPYNVQTKEILAASNSFLYAIGVLFCLMFALFFAVSRRFGKSIRQLKAFATDIHKGRQVEEQHTFPNDELGDIARELIQLFLSRNKMQEELARQQRIKQEMTSNMAHELRIPVTCLRGFLETLHENELKADKQKEYIERAYIQSLRLSELIEDVSLLSKLHETAHAFPFAPVNLAELVNDVHTSQLQGITTAGDRVVIDIPAELSVRGNRSLLFSVFSNLLDNSLSYAGSGITIQILARPIAASTGEQIEITYSDTGRGVPQSQLSRIFERFYRVDKGRCRNSGGTGLGLAIVRNTVLLHHGTIEASCPPNGGLSFRFTLERA